MLRVGACTRPRRQQEGGPVPIPCGSRMVLFTGSGRLRRSRVLLDSSPWIFSPGEIPAESKGTKGLAGELSTVPCPATLASPAAWTRRERAWGHCCPCSPLAVVGLLWGVTPSSPPQAELSHHFLPLQCCWGGKQAAFYPSLRQSQAWGKRRQQRPARVSRDAFSLQPPRSLHASLGTCTALGPHPGGEVGGPGICERGEKPPWF